MFEKKTVLILGAGASVPYGYPTGQELISKIIDSIATGTIYVPNPVNDRQQSSQQAVIDASLKQTFSDGIISDLTFLAHKAFKEISARDLFFLKIFSNKSFSDPTIQYYLNSEKIKNQECQKITLNRIKPLDLLKKDLVEFDPVSIDKFLKDHPRHKEAGTLMICYELLKCEKKGKFERKEVVEKDASGKT